MLAARFSRIATVTLRSTRAYSEFPGSVAQSKGFSKKEKAHEDQYAREKEQEELRRLKEKLDKLEQTVDELEKKANGDVKQTKKD